MRNELLAFWTPIEHISLFWLVITLLAFMAGQAVQRLCRRLPLANPVLIATILVAALLEATTTPYQTYISRVEYITFLLGPATVALAVPLARNLRQVRRSFHGVGLALVAGSLTSTVSGISMVWLLGGSRAVAFSMAPKAATTPIAMAVAQQAGGVPALTAALAIAGGIVAAMVGETILRRLGVDDWRAHGLAAGVAGSGVAAAQVAPRDGLAAGFAAVGIGLNGVLTAVIVPAFSLFWPLG